MKKFQKTIATIMAVATTISAISITSFAADPVTNLTGTGTLEGTVEETKYNVVLPTVSVNTMYDFILDPQGLIAETSAAKYSGATFETGKYLFFKNSTGNYSSESDVLTAYNLSSMDVELTVEGTVSGAEGLTFVDGTSAPTKGLNIQLGIADVATTSPQATVYFDGTSKAVYKKKIDKLPSSCFDIVWDSTNSKYVYDYETTFGTSITGPSVDYSQISDVSGAGFKLVGAIANDPTGEDWAGYAGTPSVEVVWSMADPDATQAPSAKSSTVVVNPAGVSIALDMGKGTKKANGLSTQGAVQYMIAGSSDYKTLNSNWTFANDTLTISGASAAALTVGSKIKVTFDTGDYAEVTFVASN